MYFFCVTNVSGKLNQTKDKEIKSLTALINELQREAIVMSKTMEQYSAMAAKGKALVDAFYPAPSSDGRGGRPGEVSLSSDEKTFRDGRGGSDRSIQRSRNHFLHWEGQGGEQEGGSERESARERERERSISGH